MVSAEHLICLLLFYFGLMHCTVHCNSVLIILMQPRGRDYPNTVLVRCIIPPLSAYRGGQTLQLHLALSEPLCVAVKHYGKTRAGDIESIP